MKYYTDLFTPETWDAFRKHGETVSGFRERQRRSAERIKQGDIFLCYMVRLSRWCGVLEVASELFTDATPIFSDPDPFVLRFKVKPIASLDVDRSIPIFDESIWPRLSLTRELEMKAAGWAQFANLRSSLRELTNDDGKLLYDELVGQSTDRRLFPLSKQDLYRVSRKKSIRTADRAVIVEVPDQEEPDSTEVESPERGGDARESHRVQATIAGMGAEMGFRIWVPRGDRQRVMELVSPNEHPAFLDALPLNYDETTLSTIEQIDVIWLKNRSMARAFEVEHTTAIYSGLLRMADLLALQPNMNIRLHIVAPEEKRDKVLREIRRPVFSLLDRGPLYESCSYIPYGSIQEIAAMKHLGHMSDSIVEEYEEFAQDD